MNQPKLYICYSINDLFASEAGISLTGFFENNPDYEPEEVFVLDYGIHPANRQRLDEVAGRYGRRVNYIDSRPVTTAIKREFPQLKGWRGSMAPNAKVIVEQIFPDYVERLLFIDADTVVAGSVAELQRMDMGGAALGVVPSACDKKNIKLESGNQLYFNSGVLLYDLAAWRREGCHEMIVATLGKEIDLSWPDQNLLNNAIPERLIKTLPLKYNYLTHFYHPRQERSRLHIGNVYTEEEIEEAIRQPAIIHYLGGWIMARPWHKGCQSHRAADYLRYKALSPWKNAPLRGAYGGMPAPVGVRQHFDCWRVKLYTKCPTYRLAQMTDACFRAVFRTLDKIKRIKITHNN